MQRYLPIIAVSIISASLIYTLIRRRKRHAPVPDSKILNPLKPQSHFKHHIRDNFNDNASDFYTPEHFNTIKSKIESLDPEKMLQTLPDVKLIPFQTDNKNFTYVDTEEELKRLVQDILENDTVLGLDIEQTNLDSYQGYNCLIQLSRAQGDYIIDALVLHDALPHYLGKFCENENIVKVFYGGTSDLLWLSRDYGVFVVNYFDVYQASAFYDNKKDCSLVGLLKEHCEYIIDKNVKKTFQIADWRTRPLSPDHLNYAALDSHYLIYLRNLLLENIKKSKEHSKVVKFLTQMQAPCLKLYQLKSFSTENFSGFFDEKFSAFNKEQKVISSMEYGNPKADHSEIKRIFLTLCRLRDNIARTLDVNPEQICSAKFLFDLQMKIDRDSSTKGVIESIEDKSNAEPVNSQYLLNYIKDIQDILAGKGIIEENELKQRGNVLGKAKEEKAQAKIARKKMFDTLASQKNVYEDCKLVAPDGALLCYVSRKKIAWYQSKGMGTLIQEEPPIVKLNFEPANRVHSDMRELNIEREMYTKHHRENQCVVCGQKETLSKYHVVPSLYRQYFPLDMKVHRGHDVLLLCEKCLEKANRESFKFKDEIARRHDVPLLAFDKPQELKSDLENIKKAVISLEKHRSAMPKDKKRKIKENIREIFQKIKDEEGFTDEFKDQIKKFRYNEEEEVKIDQEFTNYFAGLENVKGVMKNFSSNKEFKSVHGKLVIEKIQDPEELKQFVEEWRVFFIEAMNPQFLPYTWHLAMDKRMANKNSALETNESK